MSALTLPGDIPGLLRRGSPVIAWAQDRYGGHRWCAGVVLDPRTDGDVDVWADGHGVDCLPVSSADPRHPPSRVTLDLTDATGRAHAVWWLADGVTQARWSPATFVVSAGPTWILTYLLDDGHHSTTYGARSGWHIVPALAALDHADPRLLSDGSRWVDAEALRLVCLHVAGRAP